jgi:hypothetical protein
MFAGTAGADPQRRARRERTAGILLVSAGATIGLFGLGWFLASLPYRGEGAACGVGGDCSSEYADRFKIAFRYNENTQVGFAGAVIGFSAVAVGGTLLRVGIKEQRRLSLAPTRAQNGSIGVSLIF